MKLSYVFIWMEPETFVTWYAKRDDGGSLVMRSDEDGAGFERTPHKWEAFQADFDTFEEAKAFARYYSPETYWLAVTHITPPAEAQEAHSPKPKPSVTPVREDWLRRWEREHDL